MLRNWGERERPARAGRVGARAWKPWRTRALAGAVWVACAAAAFAAAPRMPARFDAETVRTLVEHADEGQNALILKFGYFLRRGAHPLPARDGLALVREAASSLPSRSRRWFALESILGFGGFRVGPETVSGAYDAYEAVLMHAAEADAVGARDVVHRTLYEFAVTMTEDYARATRSLRGRPALLKALGIYLDEVQRGLPGCEEEIPWGRAFSACGGRAEAQALVRNALPQSGQGRTYALLRLAADLAEADGPTGALALLQEARPLLPGGDPARARSFYDALARAATAAGKPELAVEARQQVAGSSDRGTAELVAAQYRAGDTRAVDAALQALAAADASEDAINRAAAVLIAIHREDAKKNAAAGAHAERLLGGYLSSTRARDPIQEISARIQLARLLFVQQRLADARAAVATLPADGSARSSRVRALVRVAEQLREQISARLSRKGEEKQ